MDETLRFGKLVSSHSKMIKTFHILKRASSTNSTILILGESGTGKELTARAIFENSQRRCNPYLTFNCATGTKDLIDSELFGHCKGAFTGAMHNRKGLFETANGGTLFLDEIGDMPLETQAKILRTLEAKEITPVGNNITFKVDVRIIAATNKNLKEEIAKGNFREDLYYRLSEIIIEIPPLRERENDIPILFDEMLQEFNIEFGKNVTSIKIAAFGILQKHNWPGNVREFRNVLKRTIILMNDNQTEILAEDLFESIKFISNTKVSSSNERRDVTHGNALAHSTTCELKEGQSLQGRLENFEKDIITEALHQNNGNKTKTSKVLKIDRITLHKKINKYDIKPKWK